MRNLVCILSLCFVGYSAHAQNKAEETKKKAEKKTENRIDRKIDNAIEGGLNKIEGLFKKKKKPATTKKTPAKKPAAKTKSSGHNPFAKLDKMLGGGKNVDIPPTYEFGSDMTVEVTNVPKGKTEKAEVVQLTYYFPKDATHNFVGMVPKTEESKKAGSMFMVVDNGAMITFIDQESTKMATVIDLNKAPEAKYEQPEVDGKVSSLKKTGNTKTILGYQCEEYVAEDDEAKISMWIAPDLASHTNSMESMYYAFSRDHNAHENPFLGNTHPGMMLEMTSTDKKSGDSSTLKTVELHLDKPMSFPTKDYPRLSFSNMMEGANE